MEFADTVMALNNFWALVEMKFQLRHFTKYKLMYTSYFFQCSFLVYDQV